MWLSDFDDEKKRIALGLKQLTPHPWDALDPDLKVGDKVKGKVVVMADYGAFIEIIPSVEGLIHVSEMSWSQHLRSAQDFLKVGDEVEAVILTLDREERKMSLGMKQLKADPWESIDTKYAIGSQHTAKVRNFTNFGVFVEIEEGIDGLIHISDLSWTKKIKHPSEFTQIGSEIGGVVLEIDKDNRRLSLGHKQLEENPWDVFETIFTPDSIHEGTIIEMLDKGAVIALPYGVEGFATPKHLVKEDGTTAKLDEKLQFKVIEFNKDAKRIILSHSRIFEDAQKSAEESAAEAAPKKAKKEEAPVMEKLRWAILTRFVGLKDQLVAQATEKLKAQKQKKAAAKRKLKRNRQKVAKKRKKKPKKRRKTGKETAKAKETEKKPAKKVAKKAEEETEEKEEKKPVKKPVKKATKKAEEKADDKKAEEKVEKADEKKTEAKKAEKKSAKKSDEEK